MTSTGPRNAPFHYDAAADSPDWRAFVGWPISYGETTRILGEVLGRYLGLCGSLAEHERAVALLAGHTLLATCASVIELALCLQNEDASGLRLATDLPEMAYLRGEGGAEPPRASGIYHIKAPVQPNLPVFRRMARARSWTRWSDLPATLLAPRHVAISHNPLLRLSAQRDGRVGFHHAESYWAEARSLATAPLVDVAALSHQVADTICAVAELDSGLRDRLRAVVLREAAEVIATAASDMAGLARLRRLPRDLWSGTGGYWPSRAIGLEVMRRGGTVTRFSHGGKDGFLDDRDALAFIELAVSNRFVFGTGEAARYGREHGLDRVTAPWNVPQLDGLDGNPLYRKVPIEREGAPNARRRVVYAPTILHGNRQLIPPLPPDLTYLDFQLRLVETMVAAPIDLICKPHPEGLLKGRPHPLAALASVPATPFEPLLRSADVFVFDTGESTTFWEALCTDRPVIYLDLGLPRFSPAFEPLVRQRCVFVPVTWDERNRPQVDPQALVDAIATAGPADPTPFRRLLGGAA